ncbi:hypothetical protein [Enterobacter hormaechei]|uniref:hypothetical protein n=1 Tax=Enterobacter hormaechei TaxID=158836 RepID=UPI000F848C27|nr:hypothetical protein [Enterobacter hormaechei]RTN64498.1 hypothetical protein EKN80_22045 [Enterobacter hormaechei]
MATQQRDKMCFWSTAGTPNLLGQALPETRRLATFLLFFCYFFASFLLFQGPLSLSVALFLLLFCYRTATPSLFALHKQGTLAMYTSPRRKGAPSESRSSLRADSSTLNPTPLAINPSMPDGLANASRQHSKLRTREALFVRFSGAFGRPAGF